MNNARSLKFGVQNAKLVAHITRMKNWKRCCHLSKFQNRFTCALNPLYSYNFIVIKKWLA